MRVGLVTYTDNDSAFDLASALDGIGWSVSLYLSHANTVRELDTPNQPEERIYELGLLPSSCKLRLFKYPRMRDPRSLFVVSRIVQAMRDDGIDVVHILAGPAEPWLAVLACLLRDIPVATTMIVPQPNVGEPFYACVVPIYKLLVRGSDIIIVNGANQVSLVQNLYKISPGQIVYIPLGARTTFVKWSRQRYSEEPGTVLFFGRVDHHKGLEYLIRAQPIISRQVPSARFLIAGYGQELERCLAMIQDRSKFEIHSGYSTSDVAAEYFERASLVALPYLSASTSGVMLTAYGFGKPVVTTNIGSLAEYVKDGITGFLVPPADIEQLANAIIRLLTHDHLRRQMGISAKKWIDEEDIKITKKTLEAYEKAIIIHNGSW